jgi:hypothetical protein
MSQENLFGTDKLNEAFGKINRNFGELYAGAGAPGGGATNLNELTDVTITSVANNQALVYNNVSNQWENKAIPRDLDSLTDVVVTNPQSLQVVAYNGTQWVNAAIPRDLEALSDVDLTTPTTNQLLKYNGTQFVNAKANISELNDVAISGTPVNGSILVYNNTLTIPAWQNQPNTSVLKVNYRQDEVQRYEFAQMEVF